MIIPLLNQKGEKIGGVEVKDSVFGVPFNEAVVHQAMVAALSGRRLGTADTKTRGEVRGSTRKLYRQKHTGRARRGSIRSPLLVGGGVAFGPHPRNYRKMITHKVKRLALKCMLSSKLREEELVVVDRFDLPPKTKEAISCLKNLRVDGKRALIATSQVNQNLILAMRNLSYVKTLPAHTLNLIDLLDYPFLILDHEGLVRVEEIWGDG
jgi:large subunit ribosomal protein L4